MKSIGYKTYIRSGYYERNKKYDLTKQEAEEYLKEFAKNNNIDYSEDLLSLDVYKFNHVVLNEKLDLKFLVRDILTKEIENILNCHNSRYMERYAHLLFMVLPQSDFINIVYRDAVYCRILSLLVTSYSDLSINIIDKGFINNSPVLYGHTYYSVSTRVSNYMGGLNKFLSNYCNISEDLRYKLHSYIYDIINVQCDILLFGKSVKTGDNYINDMIKFSNYGCDTYPASIDAYVDILADLYFKHYVSASQGLNNYVVLTNSEEFLQIIRNVINNILNGKYTISESDLDKLVSEKIKECYSYSVENNLYLGFAMKDDNHINEIIRKPNTKKSDSMNIF